MLDARTHPEVFDRFEKEDYPLIRREADADLMMLLSIVHEHDPEALVILIGDHGARRYRGIEKGEGVWRIKTRCGYRNIEAD